MGKLIELKRPGRSKLREWAREQVKRYNWGQTELVYPVTANGLEVSDGIVFVEGGKRELSTRARMQRILERKD